MAKKKFNQQKPAESIPGPATLPAKPRRSILMDWVVSMGGALVIAVVVKFFIADIYSIPTGSMEPVLFGAPEGGDRVFCTKINYALRKEKGPRRWEVMVFTFPTENRSATFYNENFIKRCVGLPDETVYVLDGDIYVTPHKAGGLLSSLRQEPALMAKPDELQQSLWIPVYHENFKEVKPAALDYHWEQTGPGWSLEGGHLHGETQKAAGLRFRAMSENVKQDGILDRHIKRQVVTFTCPAVNDAGVPCGGFVRKTVESVQLTASCPRCGTFLNESHLVNTITHRCPECGKEKTKPAQDPANPSKEESGYCDTCQRYLEPEFIVRRDWNFPFPGLENRPDQRGQKSRKALSVVKDLSLRLSLTPQSASGELQLELHRNQEQFRLRLPLGGKGPVTLERGGRPVATSEQGVELHQGKEVQAEFFRWDGQLVFRLDGEVLLRYLPSDPYQEFRNSPTVESGVMIALVNGSVDVGQISIGRDLHYFYGLLEADHDNVRRLGLSLETQTQQECYIVPAGNYLAFGDNQPTSHDSRYWGPVPAKNLIGPAHLVWWPLHRVSILK